jgi:ankyrin repeat protein
MNACSEGHTEDVALLLENKANIEATDEVRKVLWWSCETL